MTAMSSSYDQAALTRLMNEKPFSQVFWDDILQSFPKIALIDRSTPAMKNENPQAHPKHYNVGKYEVIDVIEDWKLGFNLGNVVKYVGRADHKGAASSDLYKALFYLNREIANRERNATP